VGISYRNRLFLMARARIAAVSHHFTALLPPHAAGFGDIHAVGPSSSVTLQLIEMITNTT